MNQPQPPAWGSPHESALTFAWGQYREWAATARKGKANQTRWRLVVLALTTAGAILGTLAYQLQKEGGNDTLWDISGATVGIGAGIIVGLATFFTKELLSPDRERTWVRARSVAEALKSETYLFRAQVAPYNEADAPDRLLTQVRAIEEPAKDLQLAVITEGQRKERLPTGALTPGGYFSERVDDQIDNFYVKRAGEYERLLARGRGITLVLGAMSVVLGVLSFWGWTAGWVAALAALVAAVGSYLHAGRYQYLIVSYQATAAALKAIRARRGVLAAPDDPAQAGPLIQQAESVISVENQGWMAKLLEQETHPAGTAPEPAATPAP